MLPSLFEMEDYETCIQNQSLYCKVRAFLEVPMNNIRLLEQLEEIKTDTDKYDHSVIHRAICIPPKESLNNNQIIEMEISSLLNKKLKIFNLTTQIEYHTCLNEKTTATTEMFILYMLMVYITFVVFATYCDVHFRKKIFNRDIGSILSHFSLVRSWKNKINISRSVDYKKLISMQGLRFFTMTVIIYDHVLLNYFTIYVKNPDLLEKVLGTNLIKPFIYFGMFVVLAFFLISSWLSTLQAYNIYERYGELSLKHVGIIIINRYFRFSLALFLTFIWTTNWVRKLEGPMNFDLIQISQTSCRNNWLYNMIYFNNFFTIYKMCNPISWYLSADFQIYLINTMVIYTIFKYKLNEFKSYGLVFGVCCFIHGMTLYHYNINVYFRPVIRNLELNSFLHSLDFMHSYTSTLSISSSSCIGMIMGAIYYKNKKRTIKITKVVSNISIDGEVGLHSLLIVSFVNYLENQREIPRRTITINYIDLHEEWLKSENSRLLLPQIKINLIWKTRSNNSKLKFASYLNKSIRWSNYRSRDIIHSILWATLFIGLTSLAIIIGIKEYGRLEAAILGSIVKPMYCLGLGIGILGMSHNMGGIIRRCFENRHIAVLSNFSFSIYMCHTMIILQRHTHLPPTIDIFSNVQDFLVVFAAAVTIGVIITLLIEEPCLSLQKKILPQIGKKIQE